MKGDLQPCDLAVFVAHPDDAELSCGGLLLVSQRQGWRTADIAAAGCTIVGTSELARRVIQTLEGLADGSIS